MKPNPFFLDPPRPGGVREFCEAENFSRTTYYALRKAGRAPSERRLVNGRVQITPEARLEWRERMDNPGAVEAGWEEKRLERARRAAAAAIKSDNHVSRRERAE